MASAGPRTITLLHEEVTFDIAKEDERNMLHQLNHPQEKREFVSYISQHKRDIEAIVACHLGVTMVERCRLSPIEDWIHGSFNLCVPVDVDKRIGSPGKRLMIRFPLPYKVGESRFPGNADEKLRCEASTYVWIQTNCSSVPTPRLWGFGFSNGQSFTTLEVAPLYVQIQEYLRRRLRSLFGYPIPCRYARHHLHPILKTGYLLMDRIDKKDGTMLSESWESLRHDKLRRVNLFRDLSRIMLSLSRIPLPCIGSFTMDDYGVVSLTNRPLTLRLHQLENEGIPTNIDRKTTYTAVESYVLDLLAYHDSRLIHQPNSINDEDDCRGQMAALTGMRSVFHHFINQNLYRGLFLFTLTDNHQSNIFVDHDWHIKSLIDLEWACSLPAEMQRIPYWLTSQSIDALLGKNLGIFNGVREEFMEAFESEERALCLSHDGIHPRTLMMKHIWDTKNFWFFHALDSTKALPGLFWQHIQPMFARLHAVDSAFDRIMYPYWALGADKFIASKIAHRQDYERQLEAAFERNEEILSMDGTQK